MASEKGYKERLLELRGQLAESVSLGLVNPELFQQQLIQMLNGVEGIRIKSQSEIERLSQLIGEEKGRIKACTDMADLMVGIVSAFVRQEKTRLEESTRLEAERKEVAEYAAKEAAEKAEIEALALESKKLLEVKEASEKADFEVKEVEKTSKKDTLPPGVNIIKTKKS